MKNANIIVTGATSGIGSACAQVFAEVGANLALIGRRAERLESIAHALRTNHGVTVHTLCCDVRNRHSIELALQELPAPFHAPDVLINNAGLSRGLSALHEGLISDWEEMIDTNLKGLLYVTRAILPAMVVAGRGVVVNIASIAALQPYRGGNVYAATKAAVKMLSDSLQVDLNGTGVRVCNIDPGLVETEFSEVRFHGDSARAATVYEGYTPLTGRDVAECVLFAATRPPHVCVQEILVTPTAQATTTIVHKEPTA